MARPRFTRPEVFRQTCKSKPDYWFCRPRQRDGTQPKKILGYCQEIGIRKARQLRDELCRQINRSPVVIQSQITLADYVDIYRGSYLAGIESPGTKVVYESRITHHILPAFGAMKMCDFSRDGRATVQRWVNNIDGSKSLRLGCLSVLSSIFEEAIEGGYYAGRNPATKVKPGQPTKPKRKQRSFAPSEVAALIQSAEEPLRTQIELGALCGLRIGEIRGLTPAAVLEHELDVFQHLDQFTNDILEGSKSGDGHRTPCPAFLLDKLRRLSAGMESDELFWPEPRYKTLRERLIALLDGLGLYRPGIGWHSLRSTYATLRDTFGRDGLQAAMGHSKPAMTDRYIRPGLTQELGAVEAVVAVVYGSGGEEIQ